VPTDYRWSSYGAKGGIRDEAWLDHDPCYLALPTARKKGLRCLPEGAPPEDMRFLADFFRIYQVIIR
jgi:hypothetical protein